MHDLVLAIGGMTVEELKERMSLREFSAWQSYAAEMGPLNPMLRIDAAVYRAVTPFLKGNKEHLLPWPRAPEREATIEDVMNILKSAHREAKK